jgi:peptidoglycan-associated lipoprotein
MSKVFSISVLVAIFLTGCSVKTVDNEYGQNGKGEEVVKVHENQVDEKINSITPVDNSGVDSSTDANAEISSSSLEGSLSNIYFAFDKFNLSSDMGSIVSENSRKIQASNLDNVIKLEGNCDEWGSDEYNYALGLKRAKSTKEGLVANGISDDRIELVSFGESNPICTKKGLSPDADCNKQNRRVEFKVLP